MVHAARNHRALALLSRQGTTTKLVLVAGVRPVADALSV